MLYYQLNAFPRIEYGAGVDSLDIPTILSQGGGSVYPVPRMIDVVVHPKMNLASLIFAVSQGKMASFENFGT